MTPNAITAKSYISAVANKVGNKAFRSMPWDGSQGEQAWRNLGLDPAAVRREARNMMRSMAAYDDAH
jgi:hypothetical protein